MLEEYNKNSLVDLSGYAKVSLSGLVSEYKIIYSGEEISVDINSFKKLSVNFITFNFVKSKEGELYLSKGVVSEDLEGEWILADKDEINIYNSGENYFSKGVTINHNKGLGLKDNVLVDTNTYKEFEYALKDTKFVKDMKGKLYYSTDAGFNWKRADDSMEEEYNKN